MTRASNISQRREQARVNDDPEYRRQRAELVKAAAIVFRRKGFKAAKLQDVAAEIGLDRASVYYYASGKDELFQEVVADAVQDNVVMAESLQTSKLPAREKLALFIKQFFNSYERHYPYLFVYVQENMAHMEADTPWNRSMRALAKRFDNAVRNIVQQGLDEGVFFSPGNDARLVANGIIGMCNWSHRWFHPKGKGSADQISNVFSGMILDGLTTRPSETGR
jgi:AcrR family transcriptional regulator